MHTQASSQREPLVFSIGGWHGIRRFLVLRDVAGEDMESGDLHTPPFRFFANADAVFFMFDPLRVRRSVTSCEICCLRSSSAAAIHGRCLTTS